MTTERPGERSHLVGSQWQSNVTLLVLFLAFGLLIHKSWLPTIDATPFAGLMIVLAVAALWRPRSVLLTGLLAAALTADIAWSWPDVLNHYAYLLVVGGGLLVTTTAAIASGRMPERLAALEADLFPALRAGVYVLFSLAVLHKLNHGFLDPQGSCAVDHYLGLRGRFEWLPGPGGVASRTGLVYGTLATEALIPVLLFWQRTRFAGLVVAFGFHLVMGLNGHHPFSGLAPSLYVPFLPAALHLDARTIGQRLRARRRTAWLTCALPAVGTALGAIIFLDGATPLQLRPGYFGLLAFVAFFPPIAAGLLVGTFLRASESDRPAGGGPRSRRLAAVVVVALLVNGMTPYLGLKTQVSFSMYSNLRTEEEGWNHLFLPRALRVFGYQDSLVQVLDVRGTDGDLAWWADTGSRTVPFELRRALGDACESGSGAVSLTLAIAGDTLVAAEACRPPVLGGPNPALAEKLLLFRPVPPSNQCVH